MGAPATWLTYNDNFDGDILSQDILVPASGLTRNTYYCALSWNQGQNGGGYCGIQYGSRGRNYIYSIWDPIGSRAAIKATYVLPGTHVTNFGHEGTGLHSDNYHIGWQTDHWYTLMTRRWDQNNHTFFGFWITDKVTKKTTHMIDMDFPIPHINFHGPTGSFLEDFGRSGSHARSVMMGNGAKYGLDGQWRYFTSATFTVNGTGTYANAWDGELRSGSYFMQSGDGTVPRNGVHKGTVFHRSKKRMDDGLIVQPFELSNVNQQEVMWAVPETNIPQFRYTVKVDGLTQISEVDCDMRQYQLETPAKRSIEVEIEDVLGRTDSQTHFFSHM